VSCTVIVCDALLELPQWSVAVQVRVTLEDCGQLPAVVTSANVSVGFVSQASVAVGLLKLGVAGHSMVIGPPTPVMVGGVVSVTVQVRVIVWLHDGPLTLSLWPTLVPALQLVRVGWPVVAGVLWLTHCTVVFAG